MNKILRKKLFYGILVATISLSVFFRFYNLNWGSPFHFHPDERNIASSVTKLNFPINMNPNFFAYGSAPIYTTYFLGVFSNFLIENGENSNYYEVSFERSVIILRLLSASLSALIIYLVFDIAYKLLNKKYALLATGIAGFNVGLIQYAHFGTFEIWLTALFLLLFKFLYEYLNTNNKKPVVYGATTFGLLLSVKISSVIVLPIILYVICLSNFKMKKDLRKIAYCKKTIKIILIFVLFSVATFCLTSPFVFLDFKSFTASINYESSVAIGTLPVFYTGGFTNTTGIIYQILYVYPFLLNPLNLLIVIFGLPIVILRAIKNRQSILVLSLLFFFIIFLSQAFLYVKWIRYYLPTVPFLIIIGIFAINTFIERFQKKHQNFIFNIIFFLTISVSLLFSFAYFKTVLFDNDSRLEALEFAKKNINTNSQIISEIYDLGVIAFNRSFPNIVLFDFYSLDNTVSRMQTEELKNLVSVSDYLILPSQRIKRNRTIYPKHFPEGNKFYKSLQSSNFELIYETPCDTFCKILYMGNPIYSVEETANVFDRPIITIYRINN